MIQETQVEQPGKNAIDHPCEMRVENPEEEGQFVKCRILANIQCTECTAWVCGTEGLDHSIICVRCNQPFCSDCFVPHRTQNGCLEAELRSLEGTIVP